jgi:predicted transposase/invertase (TIGR01784 family)
MKRMLEKVPNSWLKPKNDFVFKLLFGSEDETSSDLLLAFLNDVFDIPEGQSLVKVEILNPTFNKESLLDKEAILDVRARVLGFGYINVEIQLSNQKNINKRSLYYASKLYEGQLGQGGEYKELTKVVAINLLDFRFFPSNAYQSCYGFREIQTQEAYPDDLMKLYFFEMPKFRMLDQKGMIAPNDRMAKWLRFLTNTDDSRWDEMAKQDPMLELSVEKLRIASMDPEVRMQYEAREKALKDIASIRGEGVDEGVEKVACRMLKKGMDFDLITELTGLTMEEVEKLATELDN